MNKKNKITVIITISILLIISVIVIELIGKEKATLNKINYKGIEEKINNKKTFLIVIEKEDCSFCELYMPKFKEIIEENNIKNAYYINISKLSKKEYEKLTNKISYSGTPTTIFFENGKELDLWSRIVGNQNKNTIIEKLKTLNYISEK